MEIKTNLKAKHLGKRLILNGKPFVAGIVLHDTAGTGKHNDTLYLANPGDGRVVSVDFTVERDGAVYQLNPDLDRNCTWHAGRATTFRIPGRTLKNREVTQSMIGIEITQKAALNLSPIWPADQIRAVAELCVYICRRFGLDKSRIVTHADIITDGSRTDPRKFPFSEFWWWFNRTANTPAIDPPADNLGAPIIHTVKAGDTLWRISRTYATPIERIKSLNAIETASNAIAIGQKLIIKK